MGSSSAKMNNSASKRKRTQLSNSDKRRICELAKKSGHLSQISEQISEQTDQNIIGSSQQHEADRDHSLLQGQQCRGSLDSKKKECLRQEWLIQSYFRRFFVCSHISLAELIRCDYTR